jgi:ATP-dependent helicase/nuclease subunit B
VPTQRAAGELGRALVRANGGALILPRIVPLGAIEATQEDLLFKDESANVADIPAVSTLRRRMLLAGMTRAWATALEGAIVSIGPDGARFYQPNEPPLVAGGLAQAFALAADLAAMIDEMTIEDVPWERLTKLPPGDFDAYWRITLDFLKIAATQWPAWLADNNLIDRAARGARLVDDEIARLAEGRGPRIIAGSTGAHRATARLIGALARSRLGAAVLPDLDLDLDEAAWRMIGGDDAEPSATHPQAILSRLLSSIGVARSEVRVLGEAPANAISRARFLSEAMRPAGSTEFWRRRSDALAEDKVAEAFEGLAIIEAADEREEALALAIAMREALETPGRTAALISPDRDLTRRVRAELLRWGVEVDDGAGATLAETPAGVVARLLLAAAFSRAPVDLVALLGHPGVRLSRPRNELESALRTLEIGALRGVLARGGPDDVDALFAAARASAIDPHAHKTLHRITDAEWAAAELLLRDALKALSPLSELAESAHLPDFIAAHRAALDATLRDDEAGDASGALIGGEVLAELLDEWGDAAPADFFCAAADYLALFDAVALETRAPESIAAHPRLAVLGLLEARLLHFDLVLLAGLDETVWPPAASTDAFLNRPMRAALGLSAPERRIGQTAHDFVAALGARDAILSRAKKRGGSPTVASRFLLRIEAAAGAPVIRQAQARGEAFLDLARAIDRPALVQPARRPEPRPAATLRPNKLSVTQIETLRRDPYAIYARVVLELEPLAPIGFGVSAREIGTIWHAALNEFSLAYPQGGVLPPASREILFEIARTRFAPLLEDDGFRAMAWPRIVDGLEFFHAFDVERRPDLARIIPEQIGKLPIALSNGAQFKLSGRADRIDVATDGSATLIDYKTGAMPGVAEVQVGFSPQLTLEVAMLKRGAFPVVVAGALSALYLKLGGPDGGALRELKFKDIGVETVAEQHYAGLVTMLEQFADPSTPYLSQPYPKFTGGVGEYDHLARVKEWSESGAAEE